ncbi:MAG: FtsX-like permease family protein [Bryobacteraceae bacterium]
MTVTLVGVVFALVLILMQCGLFLSFLDTSANVVAHSKADLWITAPGVPHVNGGTALQAANRFKALQVPGVERVDRYILCWVHWKLPAGSVEVVDAAGFDLAGGMGGPWNIVAGSLEDLRADDTVMVDTLYLPKLGIRGIGDTVEINGKKARVVGLTHGIRSFTTAPYLFTSFKNALNYASFAIGPEQATFFLVRTRPGADLQTVKREIQARLPDLDVYTTAEMTWKTQYYWVFETGAGLTTMMGAVLGLFVGVVIVAQTIYAATVDHIREFGTLKAIGASNGNIYQVILTQAGISALMGYVIAIFVAKLIADSSAEGLLPLFLPPQVAAGAFVLALAMCMGASLLSIRKATTIDPAMVFRT